MTWQTKYYIIIPYHYTRRHRWLAHQQKTTHLTNIKQHITRYERILFHLKFILLLLWLLLRLRRGGGKVGDDLVPGLELLRWQFKGRDGKGIDVGLVFKGMHLRRWPCFDIAGRREGVIANGLIPWHRRCQGRSACWRRKRDVCGKRRRGRVREGTTHVSGGGCQIHLWVAENALNKTSIQESSIWHQCFPFPLLFFFLVFGYQKGSRN